MARHNIIVFYLTSINPFDQKKNFYQSYCEPKYNKKEFSSPKIYHFKKNYSKNTLNVIKKGISNIKINKITQN